MCTELMFRAPDELDELGMHKDVHVMKIQSNSDIREDASSEGEQKRAPKMYSVFVSNISLCFPNVK